MVLRSNVCGKEQSRQTVGCLFEGDLGTDSNVPMELISEYRCLGVVVNLDIHGPLGGGSNMEKGGVRSRLNTPAQRQSQPRHCSLFRCSCPTPTTRPNSRDSENKVVLVKGGGRGIVPPARMGVCGLMPGGWWRKGDVPYTRCAKTVEKRARQGREVSPSAPPKGMPTVEYSSPRGKRDSVTYGRTQ